MFRSAHTTARTQKRQVNVLKSKYPRYSLSGGTINDVMIAANAAISTTAFAFTNPSTLARFMLFRKPDIFVFIIVL